MNALLAFLSLSVAIAGLTWWRARRPQPGAVGDYFLANRSLPAPMVALSVLMTNISTEQLVGLNGDAFRNGSSAMAWELFGAIGLVLFAWVFLPRYHAAGVTTVPEFIERRCGRFVRRLLAILMLISVCVIGVPFVLYSGSVALVVVLDLPTLLGLTQTAALMGTALLMGLAGLGYALLGGMRTLATSDLFYAIVCLVATALIPVLGLQELGAGSIPAGWQRLWTEQRAAFAPFGPIGQPLPGSALLTGLVVISVNAWCCNQSHVQKAFAATTLASGQRGILLAAGVKLLTPVLFILPGLLARSLFQDQDLHPDLCYAALIQRLLPAWLVGIFAVALAGATITSLSGLIHSATTLFAVDLRRASTTDHPGQLTRSGHWLAAGMVALATLAVPIIAQQTTGFFVVMKRFNATLTLPIVTVVVLVVLTSWRWPRWLVPTAMAGACALYLGCTGWLVGTVAQLHWLHTVAIAYLGGTLLLRLGRKATPADTGTPPDLHHPWRHTPVVGSCVLLSVAAIYGCLMWTSRAAP